MSTFYEMVKVLFRFNRNKRIRDGKIQYAIIIEGEKHFYEQDRYVLFELCPKVHHPLIRDFFIEYDEAWHIPPGIAYEEAMRKFDQSQKNLTEFLRKKNNDIGSYFLYMQRGLKVHERQNHLSPV